MSSNTPRGEDEGSGSSEPSPNRESFFPSSSPHASMPARGSVMAKQKCSLMTALLYSILCRVAADEGVFGRPSPPIPVAPTSNPRLRRRMVGLKAVTQLEWHGRGTAVARHFRRIEVEGRGYGRATSSTHTGSTGPVSCTRHDPFAHLTGSHGALSTHTGERREESICEKSTQVPWAQSLLAEQYASLP